MATLAETAVTRTRDDDSNVVIGDFRIDVDMRSATVRGRRLHLNGAEFDVLVFLTSHRRRLVTSHTRLTTRGEGSTARQAEFFPTLMSLKRKLEEEIPGAQYIDTEAWLLFDFHPSTDPR
jgi:DNA-binding response OmpR family regulator